MIAKIAKTYYRLFEANHESATFTVLGLTIHITTIINLFD